MIILPKAIFSLLELSFMEFVDEIPYSNHM